MTPEQASSSKVIFTILAFALFIFSAHADDSQLVSRIEPQGRGRSVRPVQRFAERTRKRPGPVQTPEAMDQTPIDPGQGVEPVQSVEPVQGVHPAQGVTGAEDEFDREFGALEMRKTSVALPVEEAQKRISVYIPPDPGVEMPDSLQPEEIRQVVVANRLALRRCAEEQQMKKLPLPSKMVMQWTILPNGRTAEVTCATDELRQSELAHCVGSLIRRWRFPQHKVQGEPINVPFTF